MDVDVSEAADPEAKDASLAGDEAMAAGALKAYTAIKSSNSAAPAPAKILQSTVSSHSNASPAKPSPSSSGGGATDGLDYDSPYLLRRTAKDFGGQLFYGTVVQCRTVKENGDKTYWYVVYDDGDDEDLDAEGLAVRGGSAPERERQKCQ